LGDKQSFINVAVCGTDSDHYLDITAGGTDSDHNIDVTIGGTDSDYYIDVTTGGTNNNHYIYNYRVIYSFLSFPTKSVFQLRLHQLRYIYRSKID
jgi:hypothetical protein